MEEGLVDYVAMDIKNAPARYGETVGFPKLGLGPIEKSVAYLMSDAVDYEFRTTVVQQLHRPEDMAAIAEWLSGAKRYFLQQFKQSEQVPNEALTAPDYQTMQNYLRIVLEQIPAAELRGI